jgi:hypothetical protein
METISAGRRIRQKPQQASRCAGSPTQQSRQRTPGTVANGFLRHRFMPLFEQGNGLPEQQGTEREFLHSLSILTGLYGCEIRDIKDKPYPYNILLACKGVLQQLRASGQQVALSVWQDEKQGVKLATTHRFDTDTTLYYIPVIPLYNLLQDKAQKQTAELLLSVFAYLYHLAGIPYYRDDYSALSHHYDCMEEWCREEMNGSDDEDNKRYISEINKAKHCGDVMQRKIYNRYHLQCFGQRLDRYKPLTVLQCECLRIAKKANALMLEYPDQNIFRYTNIEQQDADNEWIHAGQYISFIAHNEGALFRNISQMVNDEFNECGQMEEPILKQVYETGSDLSKQGLDFEYRLFPLMADLCTLLNDLP